MVISVENWSDEWKVSQILKRCIQVAKKNFTTSFLVVFISLIGCLNVGICG